MSNLIRNCLLEVVYGFHTGCLNEVGKHEIQEYTRIASVMASRASLSSRIVLLAAANEHGAQMTSGDAIPEHTEEFRLHKRVKYCEIL